MTPDPTLLLSPRISLLHPANAGNDACNGVVVLEPVQPICELVGLAQTMRLAADLVKRRGTIVVIGEEAEFPAVDTIQIAQRELRIGGSRNGSRQDARDALAMMAGGVIRPPIAARYPLARINEALALVRSGQAHGRVIVKVRDD